MPSIKSTSALFTANTGLRAEDGTKLGNVACDSVFIDRPLGTVKEFLEKEFRPAVHSKCMSGFHSIIDVHSQQCTLVDLDSWYPHDCLIDSFALEYLFECVTYSSQSSTMVRAQVVPHSSSRCIVSILFECTSDDDSGVPAEGWSAILAGQLSQFISYQDSVQPTTCKETTLTFNPTLFLHALFRLSLLAVLIVMVVRQAIRLRNNHPVLPFPAEEFTETLARISENVHLAEIAIEKFIDRADRK